MTPEITWQQNYRGRFGARLSAEDEQVWITYLKRKCNNVRDDELRDAMADLVVSWEGEKPPMVTHFKDAIWARRKRLKPSSSSPSEESEFDKARRQDTWEKKQLIHAEGLRCKQTGLPTWQSDWNKIAGDIIFDRQNTRPQVQELYIRHIVAVSMWNNIDVSRGLLVQQQWRMDYDRAREMLSGVLFYS